MAVEYIVCVDDERTILLSLRGQLKFCLGDRFKVEIAESAEEAWEIIDELIEEGATIAAVISDWFMPHTKGDEFLSQLHQKYPDIVKFMLTGHADQEAIERIQQFDCLNGYFTKPWQKEELVDKLLLAINEQMS